MDNGECEELCYDLPGSYACGCHSGRALQEDGLTCVLEGMCIRAVTSLGNCTYILNCRVIRQNNGVKIKRP